MGCKAKFNNTGKSRCQIDWMLLKKVIVMPLGTEFTGSDIDDWLQQGIHKADPSQRFYPMPDITGVDNNTGDGSSYTNGIGVTAYITPGLVAFTQRFDPDVCLQNRLIGGFNDNITRSFLFIDQNNRIWGVKTANGMKGFTGRLYVRGSGITSPDNIAEPSISYSLTKAAEMESKWFVESDVAAEEIDGLLDVTMSVVTDSSNLLIKFSVDGCGNDDVTAEMQTIAGQANCWLVGDTNGYAAIDTAPTWDATAGAFKVASNTVASGKTLKLADPSVLYGKGVTNKECVNSYTAA